jgi:hypothetical protein
LPKDKNLSGVKAVYVRNGVVCETKTSQYVDSLSIEGYGDTNPVNVELYSVGRNEKLSAPVAIQITPLIPPVLSVNVNLDAAFGGVSLTFSGNESNASLAFVLLTDTAGKGVWEPLQTFYAAADKGRFARRNLDPKEQKFALYIRDRWNNKSDTLIRLITPFEEIKLVKTGWTNAKLPTDTWEPTENNPTWYDMSHLWKGPEAAGATTAGTNFCTLPTAPMPQHFTIDLGYKASLSRIKVWPRNNYELYSGMYLRFFELWGSDNPPADGSWDNWTRLGSWEVFKPSGYGEGSDVGPVTTEDTDYFRNSQEYEILPTDEVSDPYRVVRYIRFKTLNTFLTYQTGATNGSVMIAEIALWGKLTDE